MLNVNDMTLEQKIGTVLCSCVIYDKDENEEFLLDLIKKRACSCVRISAIKGNRERIKRIREAADYPILILTDMERGYDPSDRELVPMLSLAACGNPEYVRAFAAAIAHDAMADGFSGCWSPVLDILHANSPGAVARKAGDSPEKVLEFARELNKVFASYNFQSTGKHYPGGGLDLPLDTHMVEGVCSKTEEELLECDLVPYLELWREGLLPSIMTRHCVFPNIDPDYPASLSKKVIDIIKRQGYDGLFITDSLAMMGIMQKYGEKEAYALALMAGNDIIMPNCRTKNEVIFNLMLEAYHEGLFTEERLNEACERVLKYAEQFAKPGENPYPVPENIDEILSNVSRDCITAICDDGFEVSIPTDKKRLFIVMTDQGYAGVDQEIKMGGWYSPKRIVEAITKNFPNADIELISEYPDAYRNEQVLNAATKHDEVVFVTYCATGPYLGTDCLTRRIESVINALTLSGKIETIVHFGNPFALDTLIHVPRRIFGYSAPKSQTYAIEALAGVIEAKGKNPFPTLLK